MNMSIKFDASEVKAFNKNLNNGIATGMKEAIRTVTLSTERDAKLLCPVDTGNLRESIYSVVHDYEGVVATSDIVDYAIYVHEGHITNNLTYVDGQPFLTDAMDQNVELMEQKIQKVLKSVK